MHFIKIEIKYNDFFPLIIINFLGIKIKLKNKSHLFKKKPVICDNDKTLLIFDHALGGGTETFLYNYIDSVKNPILRIQYSSKYNMYKMTYILNGKSSAFYENNIESLFKFLGKINFQEIILNNLVGYSYLEDLLWQIVNLAESKNTGITYMVHDYYLICPVYTLTNTENQYCKLNFDKKYCSNCGYHNTYIKPKEVGQDFDIFKWQEMWKKFLSKVCEIRTFSPSARNIVAQVYPDFAQKLTVVPHKIKPFFQGNKINVGILGTLVVTKGLNVVLKFLDYLDENNINNIQIYVIGKFFGQVKNKKLIVLGEYDRDDLPQILAKNNIDIIFIPSIWPETFSYTTAEAINLGYPVMCFDMGGQADQVKNYKKGIITSQNAADIYKNIIKYAEREKIS